MRTQSIYNENCLDTMGRMNDNFINLTVTSPPYDDLRNYNGYSFDFEGIAKELYRVTKDGGVVVWVISDATIKGSETGTSFKQALFFKECGFNLHDTMIWNKKTFTATGSLKVRYAPVFEYMFIFSKGKPKTFNPIKDRKNKTFNNIYKTSTVRQKDGTTKKINNPKPIKEFGQRHNIWNISTAKPFENHPAAFPVNLAYDHIISWTKINDLVFDCFMGSGTTAIACLKSNRNYIGSEISSEYYKSCQERIKQHKAQQRLF